MRVETHFAGSDVVVWLSHDHYIDVRRDVRRQHLRLLEVVRNGRVYIREYINLCDAPRKIIEYMRSES